MTSEPAQSFGRYRVTGLLGSGGMGVVHRAEDTVLGRPVALKLLSDELSNDHDFRERFGREAALLAKLDSPNVVHIYDFGEVDGTLFMATQLVDGSDLAQLLRTDGPLDLAATLDVVAQLCEGLSSAHEVGVIHRDVKPGNVLVRRRGRRLQAFLCDFGIAATAESEHTRAGGVVGSPAYMAPERHLGARPDIRGDVYSLGCVLWTLLVGRPPYGGSALEVGRRHIEDPLPRLAGDPAVAGRLNQVLGRALAKSTADRHRSVDEFAADLRSLPVPAEPVHLVAAADADESTAVDRTVVSPWAGEVTMFGARTTLLPPASPTTGAVPHPPETTSERPAPVSFSARDTRRIERVIAEVRETTGTSVSVYIGPTSPPPREFALRLHASLDRPRHGVLLMIDPVGRVFEIVTGDDVRRLLPDPYVADVARRMQATFAAGDLTAGLVEGVRDLGRLSG